MIPYIHENYFLLNLLHKIHIFNLCYYIKTLFISHFVLSIISVQIYYFITPIYLARVP